MRVQSLGQFINHSTNRGFGAWIVSSDEVPAFLVVSSGRPRQAPRPRVAPPRLGRHVSRFVPDMKPVPCCAVGVGQRLIAAGSVGFPSPRMKLPCRSGSLAHGVGHILT